MELATIARYGLNPVIVVLNNRGYGTERQMQDGPYNDLWPLRFSRLPEVFGAGRGWSVDTEEDLDKALREAEQWTDGFCILEARLAQNDRSPALERLATRLGRRI
jgi:indolepyruvate decarboxylase